MEKRCCIYCGRDTRSKGQVCSHCSGGRERSWNDDTALNRSLEYLHDIENCPDHDDDVDDLVNGHLPDRIGGYKKEIYEMIERQSPSYFGPRPY
jgi:hypothetical protein